MNHEECSNCRNLVHEDELGYWVDQTGGNACLQESPENEFHTTN
jgi:hypothetical protein